MHYVRSMSGEEMCKMVEVVYRNLEFGDPYTATAKLKRNSMARSRYSWKRGDTV